MAPTISWNVELAPRKQKQTTSWLVFERRRAKLRLTICYISQDIQKFTDKLNVSDEFHARIEASLTLYRNGTTLSLFWKIEFEIARSVRRFWSLDEKWEPSVGRPGQMLEIPAQRVSINKVRFSITTWNDIICYAQGKTFSSTLWRSYSRS